MYRGIRRTLPRYVHAVTQSLYRAVESTRKRVIKTIKPFATTLCHRLGTSWYLLTHTHTRVVVVVTLYSGTRIFPISSVTLPDPLEGIIIRSFL